LQSFHAASAAVAIRISSHCVVRNGIYGDNKRWGVFTSHADYVCVENNECYGSEKEHGIYISNSCTDPIVRRNRCHNNRQCGIHMNGDRTGGGDGLIKRAIVAENVLYDNGVGGGSGINMDGVQDSVIYNNLLYGNHANGIAAYQEDGAAG